MKKVAEMKDFQNEKMLRVSYEDEWVLLCLHKDKVYAISDKCPHMGTSLYKGTLDDGIVTCKSHKAQIDIQTGEIKEKAKILFLKMPTKKAKTYDVVVKEDSIFIK